MQEIKKKEKKILGLGPTLVALLSSDKEKAPNKSPSAYANTRCARDLRRSMTAANDAYFPSPSPPVDAASISNCNANFLLHNFDTCCSTREMNVNIACSNTTTSGRYLSPPFGNRCNAENNGQVKLYSAVHASSCAHFATAFRKNNA